MPRTEQTSPEQNYAALETFAKALGYELGGGVDGILEMHLASGHITVIYADLAAHSRKEDFLRVRTHYLPGGMDS